MLDVHGLICDAPVTDAGGSVLAIFAKCGFRGEEMNDLIKI